MTLTNQFIREKSHDAFGAAVELRRHAFAERRDLCDAQRTDPFLADSYTALRTLLG
jgi:hypothetical protein